MNGAGRILILISIVWFVFRGSGGSLKAQTDAGAVAEAMTKLSSITSDQLSTATNFEAISSSGPIFKYDQLVQVVATSNTHGANQAEKSRTESGQNGGTNDDGLTMSYQIPEANLYMEMLSATNGFARILLHGATNEVYELMAKISPTDPAWHPEQALHRATNEHQIFAVVPIAEGTNMMFFWARDWTKVDENHNGIPDWWEWENFGGLNINVDGDYDGNGLSIREAFLSRIDPNRIRFVLSSKGSFTVSHPTAKLHMDVYKGHPFSMAVLVDSTNYAKAIWQPWKAETEINLGQNQGWHEVRVGIRGRANTSLQTWKWVRFQLDLAPLKISVTEPTNLVTAGKYVQIKGETSKPLSAIHYDIVNEDGVRSNEWALSYTRVDDDKPSIIHHYFECVDVALANGTNQITVNVTDKAGNPATALLRIILDPKSATNPPAITLHWPQNGTQISGENFGWRGIVSDPNVDIRAFFVSSDGSTNSSKGVVERDGSFWIPNLPLHGGSNYLSMVAANASGLAATTNIMVVKSDLKLTIDRLTVTNTSVGGTISKQGYSIWVNGHKLKAGVDGKWRDDKYNQVRSPSDTTVILQVRAIPYSDHGGNGIPGNINPQSSQAVDMEATAVIVSGIYISSYIYEEHVDYLKQNPQSDGSCLTASDEDTSWANGKGGKRILKQWSVKAGVTNFSIGETCWPASRWPQPIAKGVSRTWSNSTRQWETNRMDVPPPFDQEQSVYEDADYISYDGSKHIHKIVVTKMGLSTGGQAIAGRVTLHDLSARNIYALDVANPEYRKAVPPNETSIGTYGMLGSDGHLWVVIPNGLP